MDEARDHYLGDEVEYASTPMDAAQGADALVIVTEWNQFRMLDLERVRGLLRQPVIVDLRNIYGPGPMEEAGLTYVSVGR